MTKQKFDLGLYEGTFSSYEKLVGESEPDIIYINGGPDEEESDRFDLSITHWGEFLDQDQNPIFLAPEEEASDFQEKTRYYPEPSPAISSTSFEGSNRLSEYKSLHEFINGDEEIHFITSDYCIDQDRIIQEHLMPDVKAEFIGAATSKNTSIERTKRSAYAKTLKAYDKLTDRS